MKQNGSWLARLVSRFARKPETEPAASNTGNCAAPFSQRVTFGRTLRNAAGQVVETAEVIFTDPETGAQHTIVDEKGRICCFPGFADKEKWIGMLTNSNRLQPVVRFRTSFENYDDTRYIMLWEIQPDGRYWADSDGFGEEDDEEITLYALLDRHGQFTGPFRMYPDDGLPAE